MSRPLEAETVRSRLRRDIDGAAAAILRARQSTPASRSTLVALSGIDGCGKGYVSALVEQRLQQARLQVAVINIDGWLNLPEVRFSETNPAEHFYQHALRFDDLFGQLVLPLRDRRSIRVEADFAEETATSYRKQIYAFADVDVILLEGIYLLQRLFRHHYDVAFWIDCSFETALSRAIARAQEGLPPDATIAAYRTIYFPAQEIHFQRDNPRAAASGIIDNDQGPIHPTQGSTSR